MSEKSGEHDLLGRKHVQGIYDRLADRYDDLWTKHVAEPNAKLTRDMKLAPGQRLADLACGTGIYMLDMAREVAPGEVVGVDYSEGMLVAARQRLAGANIRSPVTLVHSKAEEFIEAAAPESFDAVSLRFALAYMDWAAVLPRLGRLVRPGGRLGLLTSLSNALPQLWRVWHKLTDGALELKAPVPDSNEQIAGLLARGGLGTVEASWQHLVRLWFDSGEQAIVWMRESGYGTHPALQHLSPEAVQQLMQLCATGLEEFREPRGVPLELTAAGLVLRK